MTAKRPDLTFESSSLFGSAAWVCHRLGVSQSWFYRKQDDLAKEGFPKRDSITKSWIKADIDRWIEKRRQISDPSPTMGAAPQEPEIKFEHL